MSTTHCRALDPSAEWICHAEESVNGPVTLRYDIIAYQEREPGNDVPEEIMNLLGAQQMHGLPIRSSP